jgi:hypothetical protein
MNKLFLTFILSIFVYVASAQGINFQGVARSANGTIIASSNISLRLSIISKNVDATPEYIETKTVVTNAQGIFSVVVGDATNAVVTGNFKNIAWKDGIKFLKVEMDPAAGTNYINMGITQLQYVPYSFYSLGVDGSNVRGIVSVSSGGTGVTSIEDLKKALSIDNIDNTRDSLKAVSLATIKSLNLKLNATDTVSLSNRINLKLNATDTVSLSNRINLKLNATDTVSLSNRINLKLNYVPVGVIGNVLTSDGINWRSSPVPNITQTQIDSSTKRTLNYYYLKN